MKKGIMYDNSKKAFPIIIMIAGIALALALNIMRLNIVAVVSVGFMCIVSALIILGILIFKKLYLGFFVGYGTSGLGIVLYYALWGADAGFGAFSSGKAGWSSVEYALFSAIRIKRYDYAFDCLRACLRGAHRLRSRKAERDR